MIQTQRDHPRRRRRNSVAQRGLRTGAASEGVLAKICRRAACPKVSPFRCTSLRTSNAGKHGPDGVQGDRLGERISLRLLQVTQRQGIAETGVATANRRLPASGAERIMTSGRGSRGRAARCTRGREVRRPPRCFAASGLAIVSCCETQSIWLGAMAAGGDLAGNGLRRDSSIQSAPSSTFARQAAARVS